MYKSQLQFVHEFNKQHDDQRIKRELTFNFFFKISSDEHGEAFNPLRQIDKGITILVKGSKY